MTQTTVAKVKFDGSAWPFYRTNRGAYDLQMAGYTFEQLQNGDIGALFASVYYQLRDCAKRADISFRYSFDQFIDLSDVGDSNVMRAWSLLSDAEKAKTKIPNPQPGPGQDEEPGLGEGQEGL
ncbi:MAG: hypothetical protein KGZ82_10610 [Bacteroidales bacterium]|nr:hypothetical protein [Bacteroidales bacterium]